MNKKRNYGRKSLDFIKLRLRLKRDQDNYISPKIILIYKYVLVIGASFCILVFTDYFTKAHEIKTESFSIQYEAGYERTSYSRTHRTYSYNSTAPAPFLYINDDRLKISTAAYHDLVDSKIAIVGKSNILHFVKYVSGDSQIKYTSENLFLAAGLLILFLALGLFSLKFEMIQFIIIYLGPALIGCVIWLLYW